VKRIFLDQVIKLLKLVDFEKSEIRRENRAIFLCGGELSSEKPTTPSVREAILRHLPTRDTINGSQIILAERATDALPGSNFTNLLDLEEYISAIVDGVVLIVESAGSICELGAFVKTPEISEKLIVLISSAHNNVSSFIKLGALKYFSETSNNDAEISPFHWDIVPEGVVVQDYVLVDLISELRESLDRVRPRGKFRFENLGDRIFLTLSICQILRGAKFPEIKLCYRELGLEVFEKEILRHLSVLEICNYIKQINHGRKIIYYVPLIDYLSLKIAFKAGAADRDRNTLRWIQDISALIVIHEPTRMRIFQEHQHAA
jgi:hypothetical protein